MGTLSSNNTKPLPDAFANLEEFLGYSKPNRAFPYLTESSKKIFERMVKFVDIQKKVNFQDFAQKLDCTRNISHILFSQDLHINPGNSLHIQSDVGSLGRYLQTRNYRKNVLQPLGESASEKDIMQNIVNFWNAHFAEGIPTGTVIIGVSTKTFDASSAHAAIVGDYNKNGTIMLYHNNWFRPESIGSFVDKLHTLIHLRSPFMVSPESLYDKRRAREWMATPWIRVKRKADDLRVIEVEKIPLPYINDLNLYTKEYTYEFYIPPKLANDSVITSFKKGSASSSSFYPVIPKNSANYTKPLCQSKKTAWDLWQIREPKDNKEVKERFEFYPVLKNDKGAYAYFYLAGRHYGYINKESEYFINKSDYTCKTLSEWLADYHNTDY